MDDTDASNVENQKESHETTPGDSSKPSINILKEAKPSANIAITGQKTDKDINLPSTNTTEANVSTNETEKDISTTTCEFKTKLTEDVPKSLDELKNDITKIEIVKNENNDTLKLNDKVSLKNRSDIFSLNENKNLPSTIFSVGGAPSKTIHKTLGVSPGKTSSNETIGSTKQGQFRNPVTGIGVNSNDEFKNKPSKRKDGNPLLGVGYKDDDVFFNTPTSRRIPPGGHSKGLW